MDTPPTAIIDACVLYSAPVRDLIVRLAQAGLIQARWTAEIYDEWMLNVLKNNPKLTRERLERSRSLMDGAVRDCLVTGYADLVKSLILPDPDDRHVLAAAIRIVVEGSYTVDVSQVDMRITAERLRQLELSMVHRLTGETRSSNRQVPRAARASASSARPGSGSSRAPRVQTRRLRQSRKTSR